MNTKSPSLLVEPIGGVSQIGSNMTLIRGKESSIYIDCGILFPYEDVFNLNYLIPDIHQLSPADALVITHGHEDHIGAICHFVREFPDTPIYAPRFAYALIEDKLHREGLSAPLQLYRRHEELNFGDFSVIPHQVNHSIPDTFGLHIFSEELDTSLFFCSDYKIDESGVYEQAFDLKRLKKEGQKFSRRLLFPDSTNILSQTLKTPSEQDLISNLEHHLSSAEGRCFITTFSSNIHRLQTIFNIALSLKRKVVLHGGSMKKYTALAKELGILETHGLEREIESIGPRDEKLIVIVSGCQGDFKSALRRVIKGEDSTFKLTPKDTFVFSSKTIPGNEKRIGLLMNELVEQNVHLIHSGTDLIHASGHAGKEDLKLLYESYNPTHIYPIHGESVFLKAHREFIQQVFPRAQTDELYNFDKVMVTPEDIRVEEGTPVDPLLIHGNAHEISREKIRERRKLAQSGLLLLSVSVAKNRKNFRFHFRSQGIPDEFTPTNAILEQLVSSVIHSGKRSSEQSEDMRIQLRRLFSENLGYKPITQVFLHTE